MYLQVTHVRWRAKARKNVLFPDVLMKISIGAGAMIMDAIQQKENRMSMMHPVIAAVEKTSMENQVLKIFRIQAQHHLAGATENLRLSMRNFYMPHVR